MHCPDYRQRDDAYRRIWTIVEPTLATPLRTYARNFSLLRKSKEEMGIDMALRTTEFDDDIEKVDNITALCDDDNDWTDSAQDLSSHISSETLVMTCHNIISNGTNKNLQ